MDDSMMENKSAEFLSHFRTCRNLAILISLLWFCFVKWIRSKSYLKQKNMDPPEKTKIVFAVSGNVGLSPRMQNHAYASSLAFDGNKFQTYLMGFGSSKCHNLLEHNEQVNILRFSSTKSIDKFQSILPGIFASFLLPIKAVWKFICQTFLFYLELKKLRNVKMIIIQNPPAIGIALAALAFRYSRRRPLKIVIDWHNLGYTILSLKYGRKLKQIQWIYKALEKHLLSHVADHNFCVTESMKERLRKELGINETRVTVVYDRALSDVYAVSSLERHRILHRYLEERVIRNHYVGPLIISDDENGMKNSIISKMTYDLFRERPVNSSFPINFGTTTTDYSLDDETKLTAVLQVNQSAPENRGNLNDTNSLMEERSVATRLTYSICERRVVLCNKDERPCILVSATSWTVDEDFNIALIALRKYDNYKKEFPDKKLPSIIFVILGKPTNNQEMFLKAAQSPTLSFIKIVTTYLPYSNYSRFLASSDLGISLHVSSSGDDIPMKLVDMLSVGLCALSFRFRGASEIIVPHVNGDYFDCHESLFRKLTYYLESFPSSTCHLHALRTSAERRPMKNWEPYWKETVLPQLNNLLL